MFVTYARAGGGNTAAGFAAINRMAYAEARTFARHPVSCGDCHNPNTMQLRVTRPAFVEGMGVAKAAEGTTRGFMLVRTSRRP